MFSDLYIRLRSLFRRGAVESELDEELRFHFERQVEKYVAMGVSREKAMRRTRLEFGGLEQVKEDCRQARGVSFVETLWQDVGYGLRMFRRSPGFTSVVVLTLALGIGANTAIFSLIDAALLKMLPVRDPEQLVQLTSTSPANGKNDAFSYPAFKEMRDGNQTLSGMIAFRRLPYMNMEVDGQGGRANGQVVSTDYFSVLGVNAAAGRVLAPADEQVTEQGPVAVISYSYWRERFGLDPGVVGRKVMLNNSPFTIVGVTGPEFFGLQAGEQIDVSVPIAAMAKVWPEFALTGSRADVMTAGFRNWIYIMARLKPGVTRKEAEVSLQPVFRQSMREAAESLGGTPIDSPVVRRAFVETTLQVDAGGQGLAALRRQFSKPLLIIMTIVALLLFVACANVANLLLARASTRQREIAVRLALGASRQRVMRQLITESVLLALGGGVLGMLVAFWASRSLLVLLSHSGSPISLSVRPDGTVLGFTLLVSIATALMFGVVPAWRAVQSDLPAGSMQGTRGAGHAGVRSGARWGIGRLLVVLQVAVSLVLMIGAGLLARSLVNLKDFYPGFDKDNVLLFSISPNTIGYKDSDVVSLYERMLERIGAVPGVRSATVSVHSPLSPNLSSTLVKIEGYQPDAEQELTPSYIEMVGPAYFKTIGTQVVRGRDFGAADRAGNVKVAIVNETMAHHYFGDRDPIGRRLSIPGYRGDSTWLEIVAVVKDARYHNLREATRPMAYIPLFQAPESGVTFEIRTATDPANTMTAVLQAAKAIDGRLPISGVKTLSEQLDDSLIEERLVATLSSMFGALAVVLACVGLYGLMAYAVNLRTGEIGIRMALGAGRAQIAGMVLRESMMLVLVGLAVGVPAALGASRLIQSELYGLKPHDPMTIVAACLLMTWIAFLAGYLPARRAMRVDPMVALRHE